MAIILLDTQTPPATPGAGASVAFIDSVMKKAVIKDDAGNCRTVSGSIRNWNTSAQAISTTELYLTGSNLAVPAHGLQVGTAFRWRLGLTKTAGTAALVVTIKTGTLGTTGDANTVTFTNTNVGTSVTDQAFITIDAILRNVGAAGILSGIYQMIHNLDITGFSTSRTECKQTNSAGFVTTTAGLIVGISVTGGTAFAGSAEVVDAEMVNI
jgi:hypothetical protein